MVANAGMCRIKPMLETTPEEWEQELAVNLTGEKYQALTLQNCLLIGIRNVFSISISGKADDQTRYIPVLIGS